MGHEPPVLSPVVRVHVEEASSDCEDPHAEVEAVESVVECHALPHSRDEDNTHNHSQQEGHDVWRGTCGFKKEGKLEIKFNTEDMKALISAMHPNGSHHN